MENVVRNRKNRLITAVAIIVCLAILMTGVFLLSGERALADSVDQQVIVSSATVHRGEEFDVTIRIANNAEGMHALRLFVRYDTSALTLTKYKAANPTFNASTPGYDPERSNAWRVAFKPANKDILGGYSTYGTADKPFVLFWENAEKLYGEGTIVTLTFVTSTNAPAGDYLIDVQADPSNTMVEYGKTCAIPVCNTSGETLDQQHKNLRMELGVYRVELRKADDEDGDGEPDFYCAAESNKAEVTIQDALEKKNRVLPEKAFSLEYDYEWVGWREIDSAEEGKHKTYIATYNPIPKEYDITFHLGVEKTDGEYTWIETDVNDELLQKLLGPDYIYDTEKETIPFGTIIVYDDYTPADSEVYSFSGWYTDPAFSSPVKFATMRARNFDLYGYYAMNVDPEDLTTTKLAMDLAFDEAGDLIATLKVTENFGFNSLRFTLDYDATMLDFVGFLYESDTNFRSQIAPTFPPINAATAAQETVADQWQTVSEGYTIKGKHFLFTTESGEIYAPDVVTGAGKLIKFKFALKEGIAPEKPLSVGIKIGEYDMTRYIGNGSTSYAHAIFTPALLKIVRVAIPEQTEESLVYNGEDRRFGEFFDSLDATYCVLSLEKGKEVDSYEVEISLTDGGEETLTYVTWTTGSADPLSYTFAITPKPITPPTQGQATFSYGGEKEFKFAQFDDRYYSVTEDSPLTGTEVKAYTVKVRLNDTKNTMWADETTGDKEYAFSITAKQITAPEAKQGVSYVYGEDEEGKPLPITFLFDPDTQEDSDWYVVSYNVKYQAGVYDKTDDEDEMVGVKVSLKDKASSVWADTLDTEDRYYTVTVEKCPISAPAVTEPAYTGATVYATVELTGDEPYEIKGDTGAFLAGSVGEITFKIKEEAGRNFKWEEGDGETVIVDGDEVTVRYQVAKTANYWTVTPFVSKEITYGELLTVSDAAAKFGTVKVSYRRIAGGSLYTDQMPTAVGSYEVLFSVAGTSDYGALNKILNFNIKKAQVMIPEPDTSATYIYNDGEKITFLFTKSDHTDKFIVTGNEQTLAGDYEVKVRLTDDANYEWNDGTSDPITFRFVIEKKPIDPPVPENRIYIYDGTVQTFSFATPGDTNRYYLTGNEQSEPAEHKVFAYLYDTDNCKWSNGRTAQTYYFLIQRDAISASTEEGDYAVTVSAPVSGFDPDAAITVAQAAPMTTADAAALLADIASADKTGAFGQLDAESAAALLAGKCYATVLTMNVIPYAPASEYLYSITLPAGRTGYVVLRYHGEAVEVFDSAMTDATHITFTSEEILKSVILLADHVFDEDEGIYLKEKATCEKSAVYYMSCVYCGVSSKDFDEDGTLVFSLGDPAGHLYDFEEIEWIWSEDHRTATARVICQRDAELHILDLDTTVTVSGVAPKEEEAGYTLYTATFLYDGKTYVGTYREEIPASEHVYGAPQWIWEEGTGENAYTYTAKAIFTCSVCKKSVSENGVVATAVSAQKITYTASVVFNGSLYTSDPLELDLPVLYFYEGDYPSEDYDDLSSLPGQSVVFPAEPEREGYAFIGWRDKAGKGALYAPEEGEYPEYVVGFEDVVFVAVWKSFSNVTVRVKDDLGNLLAEAIVLLDDSEGYAKEFASSVAGEVIFEKVPYGNYKIVVTYTRNDGTSIVRSDGLDVTKSEIICEIEMPSARFDTKVEGDGSASGLEEAITEDEKSTIGTESVAIEITQKRTRLVDEAIKKEIVEQVRKDDVTGKRTVSDYYDVTMVKTTMKRNVTTGVTYPKLDYIKVAENFQTNIFPLSNVLKGDLLAVGGNATNVFVYKRHVDDSEEVTIKAIPKVDPEVGEDAQYECYFIKNVSGIEYIAIRQKEYSVLAFGISPDPILYTNEITMLSIASKVYDGEVIGFPTIEAKAGVAGVKYTYSTEENGVYTPARPIDAGSYYLRAVIPAAGGYAAAEKKVAFEITKKAISIPQANTTKYIYNGAEQTYTLASGAYLVEGNRKTDAGKYSVTVSLADPYNTVWDNGSAAALTYDFVIEKQKVSALEGVTFEDKSFWFNGKRHSILISGDLPEGVDVAYVGNDESELGKFIVTAVFTSTNANYDASEPMTAVMNIRLNWIPLAILIAIVLIVLIVVIVIVEKLLKKSKQNEDKPPQEGESDDATPTEEGRNDD